LVTSASTRELQREVVEFRRTVNRVLNVSVAAGVSLNQVVTADGAFGFIGYGIAKDRPIADRAFGLSTGAANQAPQLFLNVSYALRLDDRRKHMAVQKSTYGLYRDEDMTQPLAHWDYEREKADYPEAHLQIDADSERWREALKIADRPDEKVSHLHLPVGARRYRPTLEDVIEFLVVERLCDALDGWREVIEAERRNFHLRQLRAAVRNDQGTAAEALRAEGWHLTEPPEPG
jgi:hypothetical protein